MKRKKSDFPSWRKRMVAAGTLTMCAVTAPSIGLAAEPATPAAGADPAGQTQLPVRQFDIPAGPLDAALDQFRASTGVDVHKRQNLGDTSGIQTQGVHGLYQTAVALRLLLENTGLAVEERDENHFEVMLRRDEQSVDVQAAANSVSLLQMTEPLLNTAQTVNVVPQFIMQEQAATSMRDTLRNVPGISLAAGEGGSQGDSLTIRGFNARNDIFLDGIRDFGSYYRDSFNYDAVEVLEGPAAVEFGRGSTGGVVNQESKQPLTRSYSAGALQVGTNKMRRGTVDINRPFGEPGQGNAFRLNVAAMETGFAGRDYNTTRRLGIAPSVEFGMNSHTRYLLQYLHEAENDTPDYGLPYFGLSNAKVPHNTYYGLVENNFLKTTPDIVTAKVDHDFNEHISVRNQFRWGNYPRDLRITEPQINSAATVTGVGTPTTAPGGKPVYAAYTLNCNPTLAPSAACYPFNTPLANVYVKRNQITSRSTEDILWDQIATTVRFKVLGVQNDGEVLVEGGRERSDPARTTYAAQYAPALNPNPYDPLAAQTFPVQPTPPTNVGAPYNPADQSLKTHVASQSYGVGFVDTIKIREWLQLSGGVRFDYFSTQAWNAATATATPTFSERLDKQPDYRASIVVKPRPNGSVYFDWGTSFNPSAEGLSLSGSSATLPPEYNETYELGAKWAYLHDRLNISGSIFRTEKQNAHETDPNDSTNTINAGTQLVRGVQFGGLGHMPNGFDVIFGYAYLDNRVEYSAVNGSPFATTNATFAHYVTGTRNLIIDDPRYNTAPFYVNPKGFNLANVAKNTGNLWVTHNIPWRMQVGFGGNYVSARRASSTAMVAIIPDASTYDVHDVAFGFKAVPGYLVLNLMAKKQISRSTDFQVNINNLTNKFFIDLPHPGHLIPGEGINAQFGFNAHF